MMKKKKKFYYESEEIREKYGEISLIGNFMGIEVASATKIKTPVGIISSNGKRVLILGTLSSEFNKEELNIMQTQMIFQDNLRQQPVYNRLDTYKIQLLADEETANLNPANRMLLIQALEKLLSLTKTETGKEKIYNRIKILKRISD